MNEAVWKQEMLWVARNEHGIIVRIEETPPESWLGDQESEPDPTHQKISMASK